MHNPKLRHRLHRVTAPTLFLRGESDGLVSADYLAAYARLLPNARADTIARAGHAPHVEEPDDFARKVLASAAREGLGLREFPAAGDRLLCRWAKAVAECVASGECVGGVIFCDDPALVCCVANKLPGLRAAAVTTVAQAARATLTLGARSWTASVITMKAERWM